MGKQKRLKEQRRQKKEKVPLMLEMFTRVATPIFAEKFSPDHCLNGTRIALDVLEAAGIDAVPLVTHCVAMNRIWYKLLEEHGGTPPDDIAAQQWVEQGGWALGTDGQNHDDKPGYPAHLIVYASGQVLDTSSGQMARPAKNIIVPPMIIAPAPTQFFLGKKPIVLSEGGGDDGTVVSYMARPTDISYKAMPGYQRSPWNQEIARDISTKILELLKAAQ